MATPRKFATAAERKRVGRRAIDYLRSQGVDVKQFKTLEDAIDAAYARAGKGGDKPAGTPQSPNPKPEQGVPPEAGGLDDIPLEGSVEELTSDVPADPQKRAPASDANLGEVPDGGVRPAKRLTKAQNERNYQLLITAGYKKGQLDKMSPAQRAAEVEKAKAGKGQAPAPQAGSGGSGKAPPPKQKSTTKKAGGKKGGGDAPPPAKPGPAKSVVAGELDDPEIEAGKTDQQPKTQGKPAPARAANLSEWIKNPSQPLPDKMGYFDTPASLRAAHWLSKQPILGPAAAGAAYVFGKPFVEKMMGGGDENRQQQQQPIPLPGLPPQGVDTKQYWDQYRTRIHPKDEIPWWVKEGQQNQMAPPPAIQQQSVPADGQSTSVDIIRRLKGMS